ncbi:hypothetical protein [Kibdelosporangium philippinense]|uniref:hypothetical protein n=1 Tax=Kibdelosporangium philippinense TaxID=211113 RepID=UPI00360BD367
MSTVPEHRVHHSGTGKCTSTDAACDSLCWKVCFGVPERWTRCAGTVDTVCRSGGHGVSEWWTRRGCEVAAGGQLP